VNDDLRNLQAGDDGAAILDAVSYSVNLLKQEPDDRLRILLLFSETRDHGSIAKIDDVVSAIGQSNAVMYALGSGCEHRQMTRTSPSWREAATGLRE
jgi:hypothetical protein